MVGFPTGVNTQLRDTNKWHERVLMKYPVLGELFPAKVDKRRLRELRRKTGEGKRWDRTGN